MVKPKRIFLTAGLTALLSAIFVFAGMAYALEIYLVPDNVQRVNAGKVRINIYANPLSSHISMGVKISFDPSILQVEAASKYEDVDNGWILDADGNPSTTDDQYNSPPVEVNNTTGYVMMFGGRLTGLSGDRLLGWIDFEAVGNGNANLNVDLAKYHPNHPTQTFDNFVRLSEGSGVRDEPTNVPASLGGIFVADDACQADLDFNGAVDYDDLWFLRNEWRRNDCHNPGVVCRADLDNDGSVNYLDAWFFRGELGTRDCPTPP